jgi:single-stranded DNA-binding protein
MIEAALLGTLARDPERKSTKTGRPYLRFSIRVAGGEDATWISVMAFDGCHVEAPEKLVGGTRVYVEGGLRLGEWTDNAGVKKASVTCFASYVRPAAIGRNKPKRNRNGTQAPPPQEEAPARAAPPRELDDAIPF